MVGVYDAFGGNDEPIDAVADQLRAQGLKQAFSPLRIKQLPQGSDYQRCEESGSCLIRRGENACLSPWARS